MGEIFSDFLRGGIASIADSRLREKILVEIDFLERRLSHIEKIHAESRLRITVLEKENAELLAKIPPDNMIDIGPCFIMKFKDGSISEYPYCPKCRTIMNSDPFDVILCKSCKFEMTMDNFIEALSAGGYPLPTD